MKTQELAGSAGAKATLLLASRKSPALIGKYFPPNQSAAAKALAIPVI